MTENVLNNYAEQPIVTIDNKRYFEEDVKKWLKTINETEEARDKPEEDRTTLEELLESLENWDEKQWALFAYKGFDPCYISDISYLDIYRDAEKLDGEYYLVLTDDEADEKLVEYLDGLVEEQLGESIFRSLHNYIDFRRMARDEDRGSHLDYYDGTEWEVDVNGTAYFVYRQ